MGTTLYFSTRSQFPQDSLYHETSAASNPWRRPFWRSPRRPSWLQFSRFDAVLSSCSRCPPSLASSSLGASLRDAPSMCSPVAFLRPSPRPFFWPLGRLGRSACALATSATTFVGPFLGQAGLFGALPRPLGPILLRALPPSHLMAIGSRCPKPHRGERGFLYPAESLLVRSLPSAEWKSPLPQRHGTRRSSPTLVDSSPSFRGAKRQCPWYLSPSQL